MGSKLSCFLKLCYWLRGLIMCAFKLRFSTVDDIIDTERIDDIIRKALRTFEKVFPISYKTALLETVMNRPKVQIDNSYLLNSSPTASAPLKKGILVKRGAKMKTWKRRWFVAMNEADNYAICYGTNESGKEEISRFSCCGYVKFV